MVEQKVASLTESLYVALATTYALYLKTQCYHWNVKGMNFQQLHALFEEQYKDLANAADTIAEQIIMLGFSVRASLEDFAKFAKISSANEDYSDLEMISDLLHDHRRLQKIIDSVLISAEEEQQYVVSDILISRLKSHQKACWILESLSS